jgi:SP family general alpha glucoside:H+ symporter-like MFS transporter
MDTPTETKEPIQVRSSPAELLAEAEDAINTDHELTILQAIKLYPKACAWSMVLSAALIMDGYDYHVIPALYALPSFQKKFGQVQPNGSYTITAAWQSGLSNGSTIGQLLGLFLAGYLTERFGFRKTLMFTLVLIPCIIFIQFFASSLAVLEVGQILLGEWLRIYLWHCY